MAVWLVGLKTANKNWLSRFWQIRYKLLYISEFCLSYSPPLGINLVVPLFLMDGDGLIFLVELQIKTKQFVSLNSQNRSNYIIDLIISGYILF
jgi:hypothetical protein